MAHNATGEQAWTEVPPSASEALTGALQGLSGAIAPLSTPLFEAVWEAEDRITGLLVLTEAEREVLA